MKTCNKCNIEKDDAEFYSDRNACKACERERIKLYRQNHAEKDKERKKRYYEKNAEKVKERNKRYRQNHAEKVKESKKRYRQNNAEKEIVRGARVRAKQKQLPFDLQEEDIMIPQVCPVFGTPLQKGEKFVSPDSPTLDRIVPEKGYVKGNVIVVSSKANMIKSSATPEEIIAVGEYYKKLLEEAKKNE